jgi:hypothetical protein
MAAAVGAAPALFSKIGIALAAFSPDLDYFFAQLKSIQDQSHSDWICWVSLDPSPKISLELIRTDFRFRPFFEDSRFHWSANPTCLGHLKNFEFAIQSVVRLGVDAVACCDQDDVWFPEKLEKSLEMLSSAGAMGLVFCDMNLVDGDGKVSDRTAWEVEKRGIHHTGTFDLIVRNVVPGTGMLMDSELARKFPIIPEVALYHDHWYPLIASRIGKIQPIQTPLYGYRIHGGNVAGLSPYQGMFARRENEQSLWGKCTSVWSRSHLLAKAFEGAGLKLTWIEKFAFVEKWDLGLLLFIHGMASLFSDPALARACFARALGKVLSLLE